MGEIISFTCNSCSHTVEALVGCGMTGACYDAAVCVRCNEIRGVPVEPAPSLEASEEIGPLNKCPECAGEDLRPLAIPKNLSIGAPHRIEAHCPSCLRGSLIVEEIGMWD